LSKILSQTLAQTLSEVEGSEVEGSEVEGSEVEGSEVEGPNADYFEAQSEIGNWK